MEISPNSYLPGDQRLVEKIVYELKSQGIFDQFRKECFSDVDTKPAYQNLRQRVEGSVVTFLKDQNWRPDMNKNQVREMLRKKITESGYLETGVERIVDQVVNPKMNTIFLPKIEEVVYKFLGIQKPSASNFNEKDDRKPDSLLLPDDLEAISPEPEIDQTIPKIEPVESMDTSTDDHMDGSIIPKTERESKLDDQNLNKIYDNQNIKQDKDEEEDDDTKMEEDESPPFEPLDVTPSHVHLEENSVDSQLSISSFRSAENKSSNNFQSISSSVDLLSSVTNSDDNNSKMEFGDESQSKFTKSIDFSNSSVTTSDKKKYERSESHRSGDSSEHRVSRHKHSSRDRERRDRESKSLKTHRHSESSGGGGRSSSKHKSNTNSSNKDEDKNRERKSSSSTSKIESSKNGKDSRYRSRKESESYKSNSSKESRSRDTKNKDVKFGKDQKYSSSNSSNKKSSSSSSSAHKHSSRSDRDRKKSSSKDDHYSAKEKKTHRRSTDRDSNDGNCSKPPTSSTISSQSKPPSETKANQNSEQQEQKESKESGGNEDNCEDQQIRVSKPKFASNMREAMRLMKIRKQLTKLEKQQQLSLASVEVTSTVISSSIDINDLGTKTLLDENGDGEKAGENNGKFEISRSNKEDEKNRCISQDNWDKMEAMLHEQVGEYKDEDDDRRDEEKDILKNSIDNYILSESEDCCKYFETVNVEKDIFLKFAKEYISTFENEMLKLKNFDKKMKPNNNNISTESILNEKKKHENEVSDENSEAQKENKEFSTVEMKQKRSNKMSSQRYSSEDLYKPRPTFKSSRRRGIENMDK